MDPLVLTLVLTAAVLHAAWNALVKVGGDALVRLAMLFTFGFMFSVPLVAYAGLPDRASWPWLLGSVAGHQVYFAFLVASYRTGDLSTAYPIARGVAPMLVALGGWVVAGETLPVAAWLAIAILSAGVLSIAVGESVTRARRAALAYAAAIRGIDAYVVMPENAPVVKKIAVDSYGAKIVECGTKQGDRQETLDRIVADTGALFVSSSDNNMVIAGQGTAAVELYDQLGSEKIDFLFSPVGGGGLLAGCAIASKSIRAKTKVIAAEPLGANDAAIGFRTGERVTDFTPVTIADGLRTAVGVRNFPIIQEYVDDILTVKEESIIEAMKFIWERMKIIIEPSSAVPFAALLERKKEFKGARIGMVLSGGNVDLGKLPWIS